MNNNVRGAVNSIKGAALINMVSRYAAAFIGLVYSVILARILSPEDFGIVAIAQVFVTFFALFQDMGLGSAIVQRQDLDGSDLSHLFGFSVLLSLALAALFIVAGIPISLVYGVSELRGICCALSLSVFFASLNTVPNALLMKSKRFLLVGGRLVGAILMASALGLLSAFAGMGPYAIVVFSISNSFLSFLWNWATIRVSPAFRRCYRSLQKVWSYSAWLFGFNLVTYFTRNTDNLLIGYVFGTAPLGNYSKAYQLMQYPQTYLTSIVTSVLHPMLAERQDDIDYIYDVFVRLAKMLSLLGLYISVFCFFFAKDIVFALYGDGWGCAAASLRWLSVSIWAQMVCGSSGVMFQLLNRTREQFTRGLLIAAITIGAILAGIGTGSIEAVAFGVSVSYYCAFALLVNFLVSRSFGKPRTAFLRLFVPELSICAVMSVAAYLLSTLPLSVFPRLLIGFLASFGLYVVTIRVFRQQKWILGLLPKRIRSRLERIWGV